MSIDRPRWREAYAPLLGKALAEVILMPIACDTAGVVEALDEPVIGFSGATRLSFVGGEGVYLSWKQVGRDFQLVPFLNLATEFSENGLNSVMVGSNSDWNNARGATLHRVELFALADLSEPAVSCAAHTLRCDGGEVVVWVSTAHGDEINAGDDLLVGLNAFEERPEALILREVIQ